MKALRNVIMAFLALATISAAPLMAGSPSMGVNGAAYEEDGTLWQPIFMACDGHRVEAEMPGHPTEQKIKGIKGLGSSHDGVWFYMLRIPPMFYSYPSSYNEFREQVAGKLAGGGTLTDAGYPGRGLKYAIQVVGANGGDELSDVFWVMLTDHDCYIFGAMEESSGANLSLIAKGLDSFFAIN